MHCWQSHDSAQQRPNAIFLDHAGFVIGLQNTFMISLRNAGFLLELYIEDLCKIYELFKQGGRLVFGAYNY